MVRLFDKGNLPRARPMVEIFLPLYRRARFAVHFVPDEMFHAISAGEPFACFFAVLGDTALNVVGYTDVERSISTTREDVDIVVFHAPHPEPLDPRVKPTAVRLSGAGFSSNSLWHFVLPYFRHDPARPGHPRLSFLLSAFP